MVYILCLKYKFVDSTFQRYQRFTHSNFDLNIHLVYNNCQYNILKYPDSW